MSLVWIALLGCAPVGHAGQTYRLYEGLTAYVVNPEGVDFTVDLDVRDINLFAGGPREVLLKVYDPDGHPVVREVIPDDGVTSANFPDRIGGWDHELQYYANLYATGTVPTVRWSAWSDPARLGTLAKRSFRHPISGGKKGVYRIVLAGCTDHYVTLALSPDLRYGVAGHTTYLHGHGNANARSLIYVPKGTTGVFLAAIEPDPPRNRRFKLSAPDGTVLFDGTATGGYVSVVDKDWQQASIALADPGAYEGKLLTMEVSDGPGDYLVKVALQQLREGAFADYVGMGSAAVFAPDEQTAMAIQGGTTVVDGLVFWHPFQVRFHEWLKANKLDGSDQEKALRQELEGLFNAFRLLETSDGRGSASWSNWAYAMGYYGFKVFRPCWLLMQRDDVPADVKAILREGLIMAGDRLSFAAGMERVNGNAFAQVPVALWYCHRATGDPLQKERFEVFFDRWRNEGWGPGAGLSRSGDAQEHFAHDMHYGSYLLDNWRGGTWVPNGILDDAKDDPRFAQVVDRYRNLYSYLYCRLPDGTAVPANPWSSRTHQSAHQESKNWELDGHAWKGEPGPDFTVNVNDGSEWFAARRANYYMLTFHGRLAPQWMSQTFPGQLGFGGGIICQLTVPGKGPVLASTLAASYGEGMHPSNWRNLHVHSIVGEMWDARPLISGISEHNDAALSGNTVTSSGEVRGAHVRVARSYTFNADSIDCQVALAESDYARALSLWSHGRLWSEVRVAYEAIPYLAAAGGANPTTVTLVGAEGQSLGPASSTLADAAKIRIDAGGFGVDVQLDQPRKVMLGANATVMIQLCGEGDKPAPASAVRLNYRLVPFVR